jgi:uncharacterized membrane protein YedE/YeeE
MLELIKQPWSWYVSGPIIGLMVPLSLFIANKTFGISSSLRHICAACMPGNIDFFKYNWKKEIWSLFFVAGVLIGGILTNKYLTVDTSINISETTKMELNNLGIVDFNQYMPVEIFSWNNLFSIQGLLFIVLGGFMVGFGARWAGGCTSGHAISGLSNFRFVSLIAVIGFFAGGLFMTHFLFPLIF